MPETVHCLEGCQNLSLFLPFLDIHLGLRQWHGSSLRSQMIACLRSPRLKISLSIAQTGIRKAIAILGQGRSPLTQISMPETVRCLECCQNLSLFLPFLDIRLGLRQWHGSSFLWLLQGWLVGHSSKLCCRKQLDSPA